MSFRGSLRACVGQMGFAYRHFNQDVLAIVKVPLGKYYKIMTIVELDNQEPSGEDKGAGITFYGTINELRSIMSAPYIQEELPLNDSHQTTQTPPNKEDHTQANLPTESGDSKDHSDRELQGDNPSDGLADPHGQEERDRINDSSGQGLKPDSLASDA